MALYKYADWSFGQAEALLNVVGEQNARALIAGELRVERVGDTLLLKEAVKTLFDKKGRRIPPKNLTSSVCDVKGNFRLIQPKLDYATRLAQLDATGFLVSIEVANYFRTLTEKLISQVRENEQTENLLNGVYLPIIIPQTKVVDIGKTTETFLTDPNRKEFSWRSFTNHLEGHLAGEVSVVKGSRYEQLLERLVKEEVVALYFPNPLQGFSVHAQREQMTSLPEGFILSGPLDTAIGWIMYPDVLGRDVKTPVNDCSAVQWRSPWCSLYFFARAYGADFGSRGDLFNSHGGSSGGLLFVG